MSGKVVVVGIGVVVVGALVGCGRGGNIVVGAVVGSVSSVVGWE